MLETIEVRGPKKDPTDRRRVAEGRKEANAVARQLVLQMIIVCTFPNIRPEGLRQRTATRF